MSPQKMGRPATGAWTRECLLLPSVWKETDSVSGCPGPHARPSLPPGLQRGLRHAHPAISPARVKGRHTAFMDAIPVTHPPPGTWRFSHQ